MRDGRGEVIKLMNKIGNQSNDPRRSIEQVNNKNCDQSSDLQRSAEQATANLVTKAHMQAHGKASPFGYPANHEHLLRRLLDALTQD